MLGRFRRFLALLAASVALFASTSAAASPAPSSDSWVAVRMEQAGVAAAGVAADSLEARGYRVLPVPAGMDLATFRAWLRRQPGVISVTPDARVYAAVVPDDPFYNDAQRTYLELIEAPAGWDLTTSAAEVVVAIVDTGIDLTHEDLTGRLWQNPLDANDDGIDDDNNGCIDDRYGCRFINLTPGREAACGYTSSTPTGDVLDDNGKPGDLGSHGTIVSGIVGAKGDNGLGVAGVAWNVRIMTLKVLDCGSAGGAPTGEMTNVAQAIDYARIMGADIINLSLSSLPGDPEADLPMLRDAIALAEAQGVIVVAAAGNHGAEGAGFPAAYTQFENVIGVGASDTRNGNSWASYSSYGPGIDFAAPGNDLASTIRSDIGIAPPYGQIVRGTSYSAPLVTGLFALMKARNSRLTAEEYIAIARATATPTQAAGHGGNWSGSGLINIGAALARIPMTVTGAALHDWMDVAPGTSVRAIIDGTACGVTNTEAFGPLTRYSLRIASAAETSGCGEAGAEIELLIGGAAAVPTLSWGGQDEALVLVNRDVSSVTPPPGAIVVQSLGAGWSLVAHLSPGAALPGAASYLPSSWSQIHVWDSAAGDGGAFAHFNRELPAFARSLASLNQYDVFWVDGSATNVALPNPNPPATRLLTLAEGWNAFLYTGQSRSVEDGLAELSGDYDQVLQYDNLNALWRSYLPGQARVLNDFGGLFPIQIYWVHLTAPRTLTLQ